MPLIGAHVSVAGGLFHAFENAAAIGAETIQIFGSSPRQWRVRQPTDAECSHFQEEWKGSAVKTVFLHAPYLVNVVNPDIEAVRKSIDTLANHLAIAEKIGAQGLIFHVGSGKEIPKEQAINQVAVVLDEILDRVAGTSWLIIENSAGGGQKVCSIPAEFGIIMQKVKSDRVKVCYDTAHGFEAGLIEHYSSEEITRLFDAWDEAVGLQNIVALHINDSKTPFNSHHDRHENIGAGYLGLAAFKNLAREKRIADTSWILEVPGFDGRGPDTKNIELLKACF
jgi:apurinic endonuclease APN1